MAAVASPEEACSPLDSTKPAEGTYEKPRVENDHPSEEEIPQVSEETLELLSRQLEYYFSVANLSKDTYLRTLRDLNDGYVPATILSTFGKVQQMCPYDSYMAVVQAATDYSENLVAVHVDKETSKRVDESGPNTLLAIGPKDLKPIELPVTPNTIRPVLSANNLSSIPSPPPVSQVQNTIILRDVAAAVTEDDIRELFDFEKCPPIKSVTKDISNYWFVSLSTSSRDDMMNVMLALRSKTLGGEPLKARLKAGINPSPNQEVYAGDRNLPYNGVGVKKFGGKKGKLPQQQAPRSPKDGKKTTALVSPSSNRRSSNGRKQQNKAPEQPKQTPAPPPPPLVESQFPALEPTKDEDDIDDVTKPMSSDGASTATTSTTSSSVEQKPKTGYAAALLKAAPPPAPSTSSSSSESTKQIKNGKNDGKKQRNGNNKDSIPKEVQKKSIAVDKNAEKPKAQPVSWGGRRSFADILKKENQDGSQKKQ